MKPCTNRAQASLRRIPLVFTHSQTTVQPTTRPPTTTTLPLRRRTSRPMRPSASRHLPRHVAASPISLSHQPLPSIELLPLVAALKLRDDRGAPKREVPLGQRIPP